MITIIKSIFSAISKGIFTLGGFLLATQIQNSRENNAVAKKRKYVKKANKLSRQELIEKLKDDEGN